ncbi:ABC transporter permease [Fulvivirgaceae bacterium BMA10]|uniref:ABC transporter permease n=1 Tax=Splendidivirga corallicola TaxID=3051826 RepID=A0ABT8KTA3_9BACT|nr:ABC transporter permease [Fulvivirgaceae bacterium BMA10]
MNVPFFIAKRYFNSKKKRNFINVISIISMIGVAVGTTALVVVLSVINGLEDNIRSLYGSFDPELKITADSAKSFEVSDELINKIKDVEGVAFVTQVAEDNALLRYRDAQMIVKVKGVEDNFVHQNNLESNLVYGNSTLHDGQKDYAIIGRSVQIRLGIAPENNLFPLRVYYPRNTKTQSLDQSKLFSIKNILPGAVFAIEQQYTEQYVFVPLLFAAELFELKNRRTSLEIKTEKGFSIAEVQKSLKLALKGETFKVLNSDEQHSSLLRAIRIEKLFVFITFSFILAIASFNIFFSLTMLAIEKKKDIAVLFAMGATRNVVKRIFLSEGAIIAFTGAVIGLILGLLVCWIQQTFGIISMGMETSVLDAYPVKMQLTDFVYTAISIIIITFLASYRPAIMAARVEVKDQL